MLPRPLLILFFWTTAVFAQLSSFPKPSYFRQTFGPVNSRIELQGPVRLRDFLVDGKLELSLKHYLELVMANNTDVQLQMLSIETPKNAIERAMSTWDPLATASFSSSRSTTPATGQLAGAATVQSLSQPAVFGFSQTLPTGLQFNVGYDGSKSTSNSSYQTLNPALASNLSFGFSQPLLRNRGTYVNRLSLMIARSRYRISEYSMRASLLQIVDGAESAYWDVIQARENLRVQQNAKGMADASLKLAQESLKLGAISPLDIYNPEQQVANAELNISQAQYSLEQAQNVLRRQIGLDLDPDLRHVELVLTENLELPADAANFDAEAEVSKAMASRPEVKSAVQSLDVDDLGIRQAKNELLPSLSLTGGYTTQGVGGIYYQKNYDGAGNPTGVVNVLPGGYGDALSQMFGFGYPVYSFGLTLSLPIRSHRAAADMADALVQKRTDALTVRSVKQQVRLNVLNAMTSLNSSKASLKLALAAREFAQKNLDAENQKYQLGAEPMQFVLQAQTQVAQADSAVVQNEVGLRKNLLTLLMQTGELLDARGIAVK
jgi:outer membrane protein